MVAVALLVCLAIHKFLQWKSAPYRLAWCDSYCGWIKARFSDQITANSLLGLLLMIVPPLLVAILFFNIVHHLLGDVVYWLVVSAWCWYCLDLVDFSDDSSAITQVVPYFQGVFSVIFWFVCGPVWLALYMISREIDEFAVRSNAGEQFVVLNRRLVALLDWLPARCLGLSMALTSHFARVFKLWLSSFSNSIDGVTDVVMQWVESALEGSDVSVPLAQRVNSLLEYSLIVWLVFIVLLNIMRLF